MDFISFDVTVENRWIKSEFGWKACTWTFGRMDGMEESKLNNCRRKRRIIVLAPKVARTLPREIDENIFWKGFAVN